MMLHWPTIWKVAALQGKYSCCSQVFRFFLYRFSHSLFVSFCLFSSTWSFFIRLRFLLLFPHFCVCFFAINRIDESGNKKLAYHSVGKIEISFEPITFLLLLRVLYLSGLCRQHLVIERRQFDSRRKRFRYLYTHMHIYVVYTWFSFL